MIQQTNTIQKSRLFYSFYYEIRKELVVLKRVAIYNPTQINVFLQYGEKPLKCIITRKEGQPAKLALVFEATPQFEKIMKRWQNNEFKN